MPDAAVTQIFTHGDTSHWPVHPQPADLGFVGYAEPVEAQGAADHQTISYSDDGFAINVDPDHPMHGWTLFTSHVSHGNDAVWCQPIPRELSTDGENPTRLGQKSEWFSPINPELYKQVFDGKPSRDVAYLFHDGTTLALGDEWYSVSGKSRPTFGTGDRVWFPGNYNSHQVYGHMAQHIPAAWQSALGGNLLMGSAFSNSRAVGSQGHSAAAVTLDFNNLPASMARLPTRRLIYHPHQTHEMWRWTRQCKPAGGVILGRFLVMARRRGVGRVLYLNPYPIEMPDGTIIHPRADGREVIRMLPKGARTSNGKLTDGTPKWSEPKAADESFTLDEPGVVRSDRHVMRPDGTWLPKGHVFPSGTVFGPGWEFDVSWQHTGNGYYSAFGTRRVLTFYDLGDLARAARGEYESWGLPFVEWSLTDDGAYSSTNIWPWPDQLQLDHMGRLVIADRYRQGQRPHLTVYDVSSRLLEHADDVPDLPPLPAIEYGTDPGEGLPDNALVADNPAAEVVGDWVASSFTSGFAGDNYLHDSNEGKGAKSATYRFHDLEEVAATVYARWPAGTNRASNVPITIDHAGGTVTVHVDQRQEGAWHELGAFVFAGEGAVTISTEGTDGYVIADAVALVPNDVSEPEPDPDPDPQPEVVTRAEFDAAIGDIQAQLETERDVAAGLAARVATLERDMVGASDVAADALLGAARANARLNAIAEAAKGGE